MVLHLVCFKYKADVDAAARRDHRERLAALSSIDGVTDLKVGEDFVRSARSYDTGLAITFPDRAALGRYQQDARHVPVAQLGVSLSDHIVSVDVELPERR
jgi:stress responsive alpha/beta barrel protein